MEDINNFKQAYSGMIGISEKPSDEGSGILSTYDENAAENFPKPVCVILRRLQGYKYGCSYGNNEKFTSDQQEMDLEDGCDIHVQTPQEMDMNNGGMCHDACCYVSKLLQKCNVKYKFIYIESQEPPKYPSHSFLIAKDNDGLWVVIDVFAREDCVYHQRFQDPFDAASARLRKWIETDNQGKMDVNAWIGESVPEGGVPYVDWAEAVKGGGDDFTSFDWIQNDMPPIAVEQDQDIEVVNQSINGQLKQSIQNGYVYHGSPYVIDYISTKNTKKYRQAFEYVFVTPFLGVASCFVIDRQMILDRILSQQGVRITYSNFSYRGVWNSGANQIRKIPDTIQITLQILDGSELVKPLSGYAQGWIYVISYEQYKNDCKMYYSQPESQLQFVIRGPVDYVDRRKVGVNWVCTPVIGNAVK